MKKILILALISMFIFSCKKNNTDNKKALSPNPTTEKKVSNTTSTASTVDAFVKNVPSLANEKQYDDLFAGDSVYVFNNPMGVYTLEMETKNKAGEYLNGLNFPEKVYFNKTPQFDGESYSEDGIFINKPEDGELTMWLTPDQGLFKKAKKDEQNIQYTVQIIKNKTKLIRLDVGKINNKFKIISVDISKEGDA